MNVDESIWNKLTRVVVFLLLLAALGGVGVWYLPLLRQNERMRKEIHRLDAEVQKETTLKQQHDASLDALRKDPKAVERLAREKLGYARPGETVIRFEETTTNSAGLR
jgi:cell division protein FtsB